MSSGTWICVRHVPSPGGKVSGMAQSPAETDLTREPVATTWKQASFPGVAGSLGSSG